MKAYKIELLIVDRDQCGAEEITNVLENERYPNHCISPDVMKVTEVDIGEWHDKHPLNSFTRRKAEYAKLFPDNVEKNKAIIIEALGRCATMDEGWAHSWGQDAHKCCEVGGEIADRAPGLFKRAEEHAAKAKEYRTVISELS